MDYGEAMHHAERTSILYAEHRQGLFTLALSIVRDASAAEDAVHDGVHRVLARAKAPEGDPVAFLFAAVRNAAIDATRRARVRAAKPADGNPQAWQAPAREPGFDFMSLFISSAHIWSSSGGRPMKRQITRETTGWATASTRSHS